MDDMSRKRQPAGTPTGGRFAETARSEADFPFLDMVQTARAEHETCPDFEVVSSVRPNSTNPVELKTCWDDTEAEVPAFVTKLTTRDRSGNETSERFSTWTIDDAKKVHRRILAAEQARPVERFVGGLPATPTSTH